MRKEFSVPAQDITAEGVRFCIVGSRFNEELTEKLVEGARSTFLELGGDEDDLIIIRVPGAYEIPLACKYAVSGLDVHAVAAVGVIIEGETPHFDKLCTDVTDKASLISLQTNVPIGLGVVMARNLKQAEDRCSEGAGNKGREATLAALEMVGLAVRLASEAPDEEEA